MTLTDGRPAVVATYTVLDPTRYIAALHVPVVSAESPALKLTMIASCQSASGQFDALSLFETIQFD